ncbi:Short chain dehydrogenase sirQ [Paramyrothecium foliicola]|nr:Short chain dehydrogenase sirQ [Paramyrothecium foliicola]
MGGLRLDCNHVGFRAKHGTDAALRPDVETSAAKAAIWWSRHAVVDTLLHSIGAFATHVGISGLEAVDINAVHEEMTSLKNEALVFGASDIIGWAVVNQLLCGYPQPGTFSKVIAVVNRSLDESDFHWPAPSPDRPELRIISGIDLFNSSAEGLAASLKDKLDDAGNTTHVFYFVFKPMENDIEEAQTNAKMMGNVVYALNQSYPRLKSFVYSGGTRGYGIYDPNGSFSPPLEDSMAEYLTEDYKKTVAYPFYRHLLSEACAGKEWTWTECAQMQSCVVVVAGDWNVH